MMPTATTTAATMIERSSAMPDGGDHRVEREDDVEQHDLDDHRAERRRDPRRAVPLLAFEPLVNLERRLGQQEQSAADQDQVAARKLVAEHREERRGQPDDPGQRHQQQDAHAHRGHQAEPARPALLLCRAACPPGSR